MTRRIPVVAIVSTALVVAGLVLGVTAGMQWLILFGAGAFGPTLLRETGLLRDQDEFERDMAQRAGQRAYLACGVLLVSWIAARQWGLANLDHDQVPASAALACLVVTHFMSRLAGYWGPQRAATRILAAFGVLWLAFVLLSHLGEPSALGPELLLVVPFFGLAWACRRWPRSSGALMLAAALGAFLLFRLHRAFAGEHSALVVALTFMLPLLVSGLALLGVGRRDGEPATA